MIPNYPYAVTDSEGGHEYIITTWWKKLVSDYTGYTFTELERCAYDEYLIWRRDAFIWRMEQSEAGREYLDNAWRMEQTKPDRAALREQVGGGENHAKQ